MLLSLDIIGECAFGYKFNAVTERHNKISSAFETLLQDVNFKVNLLGKIPILRNIPTKKTKKRDNALKITSDVILEVGNVIYLLIMSRRNPATINILQPFAFILNFISAIIFSYTRKIFKLPENF